MSSDFEFIMLSAMYENGGNTTHRFLDGHPELFTYPFESQIGTRLVNDGLSSMFPVKYRWPVFAGHATPEQDYKAIIDEEGKIRARTPQVSKFRHMPFDFSDDERMRHYKRYVEKNGRSRAGNVEAFFRATFDAWKDFSKGDKQRVYVGYSPIIVVDAEKIVTELPKAHVLHVVRNPWSAYADTKKRPVPMSLADYMLAWCTNQHHALLYQKMYPGRVHVIRTEEILADSRGRLSKFCSDVGLSDSETLAKATWNGKPLEEIAPWGTIKTPTPEANLATANELSDAEKDEVAQRAGPYLEIFDYKSFLS